MFEFFKDRPDILYIDPDNGAPKHGIFFCAGVPLQVNGLGSTLTPFFTASRISDYQTAIRADAVAYGTFFRGMLARGVYPPPSQFEAWFLSAAHTAADVDKTIKAAREAMLDVATGRRPAGHRA